MKVSKKIELSLKIFILIISISSIVYFNKNQYLIGGSFQEFKGWFARFGAIFWFIKTSFFIIWPILVLIFFHNIIYKYKIYFGIIIFTFIIGEFFPFSHYPMYNNFPNYAYTFYIKDQNGELLGDNMPISVAGFSHIYVSECIDEQIKFGNARESQEDLQEIGKNMINQVLDFNSLKQNNINKVNLYRLNSHFIHKKLIIDTLLIATENVE